MRQGGLKLATSVIGNAGEQKAEPILPLVGADDLEPV